MKIEPLEDRIVIKPLDAEQTTRGGIVLPDTAQEKPQQGKVIAVGPGRVLDTGERAKPAVKKGQTIVYAKYGGTEIELDEVDLGHPSRERYPGDRRVVVLRARCIEPAAGAAGHVRGHGTYHTRRPTKTVAWQGIGDNRWQSN